MNKNNILYKNNNVKQYDWEDFIFNSDDMDEKELSEKLRKYNQSLQENQLKVTTINTETQPQKEKVNKKCKIKCGCPCKKRIEDLEDQVDILLDMVNELMADSITFYQFMMNHEAKKIKYKNN